MPTKTRLDRLTKTARNLPAQPAQPHIDRVIVHADDGPHEYSSDAEARAAHPWLSDPALCLTVTVSEPAKGAI